LAQSIQATGLIHPITINEQSELVAGFRRLTACKMLGLTNVPVVVRTFETKDHERLAHLDENLQMKTLAPKNLERALAERKLIWNKLYNTKSGRPQKDSTEPTSFEAETAKITGQSQKDITRQIKRVDGASRAVREAYESDKINKSHVDELIKLPEKMQDAALTKVLEKKLSVAETRLLVVDLVNKIKEGICKDALKKMKDTEERSAESPKEESTTYEPVETDDPDEGFDIISDVDLRTIEHSSLIKRTDNHVKTVNALIAELIRLEAWKDVSEDILEAFKKDVSALETNLRVVSRILA
jgi:ParB family chromosome partitioning protein